jgi:tripartite-type tricarboxylate transporter receptor subunit TctC
MTTMSDPCAVGARQADKSILFAFAVGAAFLSAGHVAAQSAAEISYPSGPIKIIVPYSPGGGGDIVARLIGLKLTDAWGQPVIIENRAGGGTIIGSDYVAKAPPDGHTILLTTSVLAVNMHLYRKLPYDTERDFAPLTLLLNAPNVLLAHPSLPARTVREFIALAKANPGALNYGSSGNGGTGHLAMEMLKLNTGIDITHIAYKGGGPALTALLSGEIPVLFNNIIAAVPQVKAGRLRALGVTTTRRSPSLPAVPTIAEAGVPGFEVAVWFGLFAPARTPVPIIRKISTEVGRIVKLSDVQARFASEGAEPTSNTPEEFAAQIRTEIARWGQVVKAARIVPE